MMANLALFKISFSTFWRPAPKCTETDLKKSQICPIRGQSDPILMPNLPSLSCIVVEMTFDLSICVTGAELSADLMGELWAVTRPGIGIVTFSGVGLELMVDSQTNSFLFDFFCALLLFNMLLITGTVFFFLYKCNSIFEKN